MTKRQKEEQIKLFSEAFHEVVVPLLENLVTKDDLNMAVDRLEDKIEKGNDRMDRHGKILDQYEKRLDKIDAHIGTVSI